MNKFYWEEEDFLVKWPRSPLSWPLIEPPTSQPKFSMSMEAYISKDKQDKYLIILGAGPDQVPAYERAKSLGIKTLAVDFNPDAPAFSIADRTLAASVKDKDQTLTGLAKSHRVFGYEALPKK